MQKKGPDSLEGMFILVVSTLISTLMYGVTGLSSMLFVASVTRYDTDRNKASFPYVLSTVLQAVSGPFAGYFAKKFNARIVVLAGSVLAFLGIGACFFAEDITTITILWGIVYGTGFGLSSLLLPVIINEYFVKQRSIALGMCYLGSPIGFFLFPPAFELLLTKYGLSGTFLILSGINMHCVPLSMLLRQPKFKPKYENSPLNSKAKHESYQSTESRTPNQIEKQTPDKKSGIHQEVGCCTRRHSVEFLWEPPVLSEKLGDKGKKYVLSLNKNCFVSSKSNVDIYRSFKKASRNQYESEGDSTCADHKNNSSLDGPHCKLDENLTSSVQIGDNLHCYENKGFETLENQSQSEGGAKQENEFSKNQDCEQISTIYFGVDRNAGTIACNESQDENQMNFRNAHTKGDALIISNNLKFNSTCKRPSEDCTNLTLLKYRKTDDFSERAEDGVNRTSKARDAEKNDTSQNPMLKMYLNPVFILMCIINAIVNFHFTTLTTIIIDFSRDHRIDFEYEKYVMMIISLTGAFGMLGFGWVTDGGHLSRTSCGALSQLIGSVCTASLPFTVGFEALVIPLAIWCMCQSSFIPLIPAITADYFDEDMQAVAISASNVLSGPLYLMIPSLIGYFRDSQGSYDNIFFLLGILSFLNFIAVSTIPCLARWRPKTQKNIPR